MRYVGLLILTVISFFALLGCGMYVAVEDLSKAGLLEVSGKVQMGPISSAQVNIYCMDKNGNPTGDALGTTVTTATGLFRIQLPTSDCPLMVISNSGSYLEESDGRAVYLGAGDEITALIGHVDVSVGDVVTNASVSPLSALMTERYRALAASHSVDDQSEVQKVLNRAKEEVRSLTGLPAEVDIIRTIPTSPYAPDGYDSSENQLALAIAGISGLAKIKGQNSFEYSEQLAIDVADGSIADTDWNSLYVEVEKWIDSPQNVGGFDRPENPMIPVSVPTITFEDFPLPEERSLPRNPGDEKRREVSPLFK